MGYPDGIPEERRYRRAIENENIAPQPKLNLKQRLMRRFPELTEEHFGSHCSDLYIRPPADCVTSMLSWLKEHYQFFNQVRWFEGARESDWAGCLCLEVPFAAHYKTLNPPGDTRG